MVAGPRVLRAAAGSERWLQERTHPGASWTAQPKPTEPEDALKVREPHLDLCSRRDCSKVSVPAKERVISPAAPC